jgi:hypothetical protein
MGQWAMGNGQWAMKIKKTQERNARSNRIFSMPIAQLPIDLSGNESFICLKPSSGEGFRVSYLR